MTPENKKNCMPVSMHTSTLYLLNTQLSYYSPQINGNDLHTEHIGSVVL